MLNSQLKYSTPTQLFSLSALTECVGISDRFNKCTEEVLKCWHNISSTQCGNILSITNDSCNKQYECKIQLDNFTISQCGTEGCYSPTLEECHQQCKGSCYGIVDFYGTHNCEYTTHDECVAYYKKYNTSLKCDGSCNPIYNVSRNVLYSFVFYTEGKEYTGVGSEDVFGYYCSDFKDMELRGLYWLILFAIIIFLYIWITVAVMFDMHCYNFNCCQCLFLPLFIFVYIPLQFTLFIILFGLTIATCGVAMILFECGCCGQGITAIFKFDSEYYCQEQYGCYESGFQCCIERCDHCKCLQNKICYCHDLTYSSCIQECKAFHEECETKKNQSYELFKEFCTKTLQSIQKFCIQCYDQQQQRNDQKRLIGLQKQKQRILKKVGKNTTNKNLPELLLQLIGVEQKLGNNICNLQNNVVFALVNSSRQLSNQIINNEIAKQMMDQQQIEEMMAVPLEHLIVQQANEINQQIHVEVAVEQHIQMPNQTAENNQNEVTIDVPFEGLRELIQKIQYQKKLIQDLEGYAKHQ